MKTTAFNELVDKILKYTPAKENHSTTRAPTKGMPKTKTATKSVKNLTSESAHKMLKAKPSQAKPSKSKPGKNERLTENFVRDSFRKLGYYDDDSPIRVEEQKSEIDAVKRLLKSASKTGKGGKGSPEFIASNNANADFLLIVECKADINHHETETRDNPVTHAVDGVLHYASHLSKEFNVVAVAVSGQKSSHMKISTFLHPKGAKNANELLAKTKAEIAKIIRWDEYIENATFDPSVQRLRHDELMAFSRDLHEFMRDYAKLTENEKPLMVSGTLIALQNAAFAKSFDAYSPEDLQKQWFKVIMDEINKAKLPQAKKYNMTQPYSTISVHPELAKPTEKHPKGPLFHLIKDLNEKVWPFVSVYHDFDVVGQFYGEFLKYTGGDKKALGIVLTPRHVTDLFARLANVSKESTVLDMCAGTGGFLVSAMHHMMRDAVTNKEKERIKNDGLIGVEQQPNMYALAASNMILRGDGKANLYQGSCFDPAIAKEVKAHQCDVGMLNPPYSQGDDDLHELVFVKQMLDSLKEGGVGIAIIPLPKVIAPHVSKIEILKHHTLEAVMTMPPELFYPVGRATCIIVFTAHKPHAHSKKRTWFAYWKDDGFIKTKHLGRVDLNESWPSIRDAWVDSFHNRENIPGISFKKSVGPNDEWCAEAYMPTNYKNILSRDLVVAIKKHVSYKLMEKDRFTDLMIERGNNESN